MMTMRRTCTSTTSGLLLWGTIAVVYPRMYFGFAFFDEAYYLALPYSFALGVRPFIDEPSIFQLAGLLTQPFVELYVWLAGSSRGLVLFGRHLYFATALLSAWVLRSHWKRFVGTGGADALAALTIAYVPFCIFGLSYNTITYFGLLVGLTFLCSACLPGQRARDMSIATCSLALVSFAYPPMFVVAAPAILLGALRILETCRREEATRVLLLAAAAATLSVLLGGATLLWLGLPQAFDEIVAFSRAQGAQGGGALKWKALAAEMGLQSKLLGFTAAIFAALGLALSRPAKPRTTAVAAMLFGPALAYVSTFYREFHAPFTTVPFVLSMLGLAAPGALVATRKSFSKDERVALGLLAVSSIAAGICIVWSSANGLRNAALGFTPSALVTLGCVVAALNSRMRPNGETDESNMPIRRTRLPAMLLLCSLLVFQLHQLWTHAYREYVPSRLDSWMETGPWAGIRTTQQSSRFLSQLENDLETIRGDAETILFFDYFPAGYLLTDLRPLTPGLWLFPTGRVMQGNAGLREVYAERMQSRNALPDVVVRMRCLPVLPFTKLVIPPQDPLGLMFEPPRYETVIRRECYSVLRQRDWEPRVTEHDKT